MKLKHLSEVAETNDTAASVPPTFADLYRFPWRRKEIRGNRPFSRSTSGTESSNLSRSPSGARGTPRHYGAERNSAKRPLIDSAPVTRATALFRSYFAT